MTAPASRIDSPASRWLPRAALGVCLAFSLLTLLCWDAFRHASFLGRWPLFDWHDMHGYFLSSGWVVGEGTV